MKFHTTRPNEAGWRIRIVYRKSMNDFILEAKSYVYPENNHSLYLDWQEAIEIADFIRGIEAVKK